MSVVLVVLLMMILCWVNGLFVVCLEEWVEGSCLYYYFNRMYF